MNKRIKKKLRKRFGIFHYQNISKITLTVISPEKGCDNFRMLNESHIGVLFMGDGTSISQQLCEHLSELKDVDLLPRFSGDKIISLDLCRKP